MILGRTSAFQQIGTPMRSKFVSLLTVVGAITVLVLAGNTVSLATTGKAILAGKINTANKMTSLTRTTPGTGLQVKTASTANSPLAVNGKGKVVNLNADKVDGFDGGTRVLKWEYTGAVGGTRNFVPVGLTPGTYLLSYEVYMTSYSGAVGEGVNCYFFETSGTNHYGGETNTTRTALSNPGLSGTTLMTQPSGGNLALHCNVTGAATWTADSVEPVRITAIPIAGVTNKGVPSARLAARTTK